MAAVTDPALLAQLNSGEVKDPTLLAQLNAKPATAADRIQATEGGILKGGAYLGTMLPDLGANIAGLGTSLYDAGRHYLGGTDWADLPRPPQPFAAGNWVTRQLDKSPITTTQPVRPDDAASRYLNTAGSVVPGALSGGGSLPQVLASYGRGVVPALGAQAVSEHPLTDNETANRGVNAVTQALLIGASGRPRGAPVATPQNEAVAAGQQAGYKFPAATTNPSTFTKGLTKIAGGAEVQDAAQAHNQPLTTQEARSYLNLPGEGPIRPTEIADIRNAENARYNAAEQAGPIIRDRPLVQALQAARARLTRTQGMSETLGQSEAGTVLDELIAPRLGSRFDASEGVATVGMLRERANAAAAAGNFTDRAAYRSAADAVEGAMGRTMARNPNLAGVLQDWQASRTRLARAHTVEDALDRNGNVDANRLGAMLDNGEPLQGNIRAVAAAANAAPKAFRVPEGGTAGGHGGFWSPLAGALLSGGGAAQLGGAFGHAEAGVAPIATYAAYKGAKALSKPLALANALSLQRQRAPYDPAALLGTYAALPR